MKFLERVEEKLRKTPEMREEEKTDGWGAGYRLTEGGKVGGGRERGAYQLREKQMESQREGGVTYRGDEGTAVRIMEWKEVGCRLREGGMGGRT